MDDSQQDQGETELIPIPDFPGFTEALRKHGWKLNPCRESCPYKADEHAHLKDPDRYDSIAWADGRECPYDLTQPARLIYPAAPGSFRRR